MKKRSFRNCSSPTFWLLAFLCCFQFVWLGYGAQRALAAPANDNFANAATLPAVGGTVNGTNVDATEENGEPSHFNSGLLDNGNFFTSAGNSVWYRWTAPTTGNAGVKFNATFGTGFPRGVK